MLVLVLVINYIYLLKKSKSYFQNKRTICFFSVFQILCYVVFPAFQISRAINIIFEIN